MTTKTPLTDDPPTPIELERDRKMEVLLDELVAGSDGNGLPADFSARVLASRPFAPWEVARGAHWRVPLLVGAGFLAGSLGLALTPLWSLGPGTAVTVWAELLAVALGRPLATLVTALPLLADGTGRVAGEVPAGAVAALGGAALLAAGTLGVALSRLRRPAASVLPRRA
jgi:hypothetical protein